MDCSRTTDCFQYGHSDRLPAQCSAKFVRLHCDEESSEFVKNSESAPYSEAWCKARSMFSCLLGRYTADAVLNMSRMFVLSTDHWKQLIHREEPAVTGKPAAGRLLDIGAGDGDITMRAARLFAEVVATENSWMLARRISQKGLTAAHCGSVREAGLCNGDFDVVSCLNLLDRIDDPLSLLEDIKDALKPDGLAVLAVVLPFCPTVIDGAVQRPPRCRLDIPGCGQASWEECAGALCKIVEASGFDLVSLSRVPYMSHGDSRRAIYTLDDAILVIQKEP